jgi:hypothetical protein
MSNFSVELATPEDDSAIKKLLEDNPVPGDISISYERSPSYFDGCGLLGEKSQTLVARHLPSGELAGLAYRSIRRLYFNGEVKAVGYLGHLRVDSQFRSRWIVSEGFRQLKKLHSDKCTDGYITTIVDNNSEAEGILVKRPRPHYPKYQGIGQLNTLAISPKPLRIKNYKGVSFRNAERKDLKKIVRLLRDCGSHKQFFPCLKEEDFIEGSLSLRGLDITDFVVAELDGTILGALALWDQSQFKQPVVRGFSRAFRNKRYLYNLYCNVKGTKAIPSIGEMLSLVYIAFVCIVDNDLTIYEQLLRKASSVAHEKGYGRIMVGHSETDPLLTVARQFDHLNYSSRIYTVSWDEERSFHEQLDGRICHIEIATL